MLKVMNAGTVVALLLMFYSVSGIADDGMEISIKGVIAATPCTVDSSAMKIPLGTYNISTMKDEGDYIDFTVTLSNCPAGTSHVLAKFSGVADSASPEWYYANVSGENAAEGIHIELSSDTAPRAGLGNDKTLAAEVDSNSGVTYHLSARVIKDNSAVLKPGSIQTAVDIIFIYS